ncbi:hypothetical protein DFH94DRAFT_786075 [Russula ochroleuca]|jgi:hypothetical protein|uniref:Uncharacterized protein n=1 Tax=Russula ochroleuca TaxID=152965 RepID=A0A9P5JVP8_9AGAM|nr:hypothetical protein DFH94DRAFT_786075 [Russula ochroleuca]
MVLGNACRIAGPRTARLNCEARLLCSTLQLQPLAPALSHNGYKDNLQFPVKPTPLRRLIVLSSSTSTCSYFGYYKYPTLSRLFLSSFPFLPHPFPFHPPFPIPILSAGSNQLDAGRLSPSPVPWPHTFFNQWTSLKPTTRTSSPLAFAVSSLGQRAGAPPSPNSAQPFHRRRGQLLVMKTSSVSRNQPFPPPFGRPSFSPRNSGVTLHVPRGGKSLHPRFAARQPRTMPSLSFHDRN